MSHAKERTSKNCLNCSAVVKGRFCQECGQENVEPKQSFWSMVQHFVYDIFHFDGKFFETFRSLITQPGRVAREYANGRKAAYLDPIRMYLFISTVTFFLLPIFTSIRQTVSNIHIIASPSERLTEASRTYAMTKADSMQIEVNRKLDLLLDTSLYLLIKEENEANALNNTIDFLINGKNYKASPIAEDKLFPKSNWVEEQINKKIKVKLEEQGKDFNQLMLEQAYSQQKMMPYILFLSLPVFTMLLSLLYSKQSGIHYSDHAAFTLYHYILVFGLLVVTLLFQLILKLIGVSTSFIFIPIVSITFIQLFFEMKLFYAQSWGKTALKFLLLSIASIVTFSVLFMLFSFLTAIF